jgi:alkylation response protein AidB-like acyl-CoA dehydrogenase
MLVAKDDLNAFYENMVDVLAVECDSRALHLFYDDETGTETGLDAQLWARAAELGWLGVGLPEVHGGLGMGVQGLDVLYRALGGACAPGAFIATLPVAQWLSEVGDAAVASALLPQVVSGELEFAAPMAPSLSSAVSLQAGQLNGISAPLLAPRQANIAVVPLAGGGFALVRMDDPAVSFEPIALWDRTRRAGTVRCNGAVPLFVIADPAGAHSRALFCHLALAVAADSFGAGHRIVAQTVEYLKTRVQFGRPLAGFQALKHRVANLMLALASAEELVRQAVETSARGEPTADLWAGLGKVAASEAFKFVADECVLLHGGVGFTWVFDCHIFLKRALLNEVLAGSNATHLDVAADSLATSARAGISPAELVA